MNGFVQAEKGEKMADLIDRQELISWLSNEPLIPFVFGLISAIERRPSVDAEPVVRCKDCKHYLEDGWGYGNCGRPNVDYLRMSEHDYCSKGEKR